MRRLVSLGSTILSSGIIVTEAQAINLQIYLHYITLC